MESMIEFVHQRIKKHKYQNGIDFTMGNGHDTLFLAEQCPKVYAFDIQHIVLFQLSQQLFILCALKVLAGFLIQIDAPARHARLVQGNQLALLILVLAAHPRIAVYAHLHPPTLFYIINTPLFRFCGSLGRRK